jgi:hypothetical protein
MIMRIAVALACLAATLLPARAGELKAEEARRLVVGKLFSFNCFEGTTGAGRVFSDGSVAGIVRFQGSSNFRYVKMPANTLRVKGEAVCASVRGMAMEPCFTLTQLDERTFRGAITGLSFASCLFTQRGGRVGLVRTTSVPRSIHPRSLHSSVAEKE